MKGILSSLVDQNVSVEEAMNNPYVNVVIIAEMFGNQFNRANGK
ncbi:MAG: hypothetical protein ACERKD_12595 [Prolixibacteraceae bacterium]